MHTLRDLSAELAELLILSDARLEERKAAEVGTKRTWGKPPKEYQVVKTSNGWERKTGKVRPAGGTVPKSKSAAGKNRKTAPTATSITSIKGNLDKLKTAELFRFQDLARNLIVDCDADGVRKAGAGLRKKIETVQAAITKATAGTGSTEIKSRLATLKRSAQKSITTLDGAEKYALDKISSALKSGSRPIEDGAIRNAEYRKMATSADGILTPNQRFAAKNYSNHTDRILNPLLRKGKGVVDKDYDLYAGQTDHVKDKRNKEQTSKATVGEEIKNLDAAIASYKMPMTAKLYRTMSDEGGRFFGDMKEGSTFTDHGYVSTTTDRNFLNEFYSADPKDRVDLTIVVSKGKSALPMRYMSDYGEEKEILLPRGNKFKISKVIPAQEGRPKQVFAEVV